MKKIIKQFVIITAVMLASINFANAQITFQKKYGGVSSEAGYSVQQTFDGGYIVIGETESFGGGVYLIKTDAFGDTVWTKIYHAASMGTGYSVVEQTVDSGFIIAAYILGNSSGSDIFLIRTNSVGDTLWTKVYQYVGTGGPHAVRQTADGGFIIVQDYGGVLVKISALGNIQWSKTYSSDLSDIQIIGSGYAVAGIGGSGDMCLLMIDSAGNVLWSKTYGRLTPFREICSSLKSTSDGGFILAGYTWDYSNQWPDFDIYVVKTDSVGDTLWTRFYGHAGVNEYASAIVQTADNGFVIAGNIGSGIPFLLKTDSNGDTLWTTGFHYPSGANNCQDIARTSDGGFIVTGYTNGSGWPDGNLYLVKTDSLGYNGCYASNTAFTRFFYTTLVTNNTATDSSVVLAETYPTITMTSGGTVASICTSTGIPAQNDINSKLLVYPNPSGGSVNIQLTNTGNDDLNISVYDLLGRNVFESVFKKPGELFMHSLDLSLLSKGIYVLKIESKNLSHSEKLVLN